MIFTEEDMKAAEQMAWEMLDHLHRRDASGRLMDELNDARLLAVASERMAHFDPISLISEEEMNRRLGVTEDDLAGFDEVDIE